MKTKIGRILVVVGVVLLAVLLSVYLFQRFMAKKKTSDTLAKVGAHVLIPTNEMPTIATVSDKNDLRDQVFFKEAENGDILLVYNQTKKAILYRPSIDKVINITTVNVSGTNLQSDSSADQTLKNSQFTVAIFNGTTTVGLASQMERQLKNDLPNIEIVAKENAGASYTENIVIDLGGTKSQEAEYIAKFIGGTVSQLPETERTPEADILIILGRK